MITLITLCLIAKRDLPRYGYKKGEEVNIPSLSSAILTKDQKSHFYINLKDWDLRTIEHRKNGVLVKRKWKSYDAKMHKSTK